MNIALYAFIYTSIDIVYINLLYYYTIQIFLASLKKFT